MKNRSSPVVPHRLIKFRGEDWIEVHWPRDGLYDIGYQHAQETERDGVRYMGLFEAKEQ